MSIKFFLTLWIAVLFPSMKLALTSEINKVKVTKFDVTFDNKSIIDSIDIKVEKVSETYNRLDMKFETVQDFPGKPFFYVLVYVTNNSNLDVGSWALLGKYSTHPCDPNDKYRNNLPALFTLQSEGKKCFDKGKYEVKDAGILKFWELVPEEKLKKSYFISVNILGVDNQVITVNSATSQSTDISIQNHFKSMHLQSTAYAR